MGKVVGNKWSPGIRRASEEIMLSTRRLWCDACRFRFRLATSSGVCVFASISADTEWRGNVLLEPSSWQQCLEKPTHSYRSHLSHSRNWTIGYMLFFIKACMENQTMLLDLVSSFFQLMVMNKWAQRENPNSEKYMDLVLIVIGFHRFSNRMGEKRVRIDGRGYLQTQPTSRNPIHTSKTSISCICSRFFIYFTLKAMLFQFYLNNL